MIFGKNAGLMLKYQKAKAKMVEYDVSKQEYPHFPLNSNELSYPTTYVLSRYSECIIENNHDELKELELLLITTAEYYDSAFKSKDRPEYDWDFLLSGASAYFLRKDFGSAKVLAARVVDLIDEERSPQKLLTNIYNYLLGGVYLPYLRVIDTYERINNFFLDYFGKGKSLEALKSNLWVYRNEIYENGDPDSIFYVDILVAVIIVACENSSWSLLPSSSGILDVAIYNAIKLCHNGGVAIYLGQQRSMKTVFERIINLDKRNYDLKALKDNTNQAELSKIKGFIESYYGSEHYYTKAAELGVLPHSSNLQNGVKLVVEHALKNKYVSCVVCTSTLAQGVNIPIKYLLVTSIRNGLKLVKARDFQNLMGRTARAGIYTEGSIIITDCKIYDNRTNWKNGGRYLWNDCVKLFDTKLTEPCGSSILSLVQDFNIDYDVTVSGEKFIDIVIDHLDERDFLLDYAKKLEKAYLKVNPKRTQNLIVQEILLRQDIISNIENYLCLVRSAETLVNDSKKSAVDICTNTLAYAMATEKEKELLIKVFQKIEENIQQYSVEKLSRYSNAMSGIGLSSLIEEWIVQNELTEKIYTETELLYVITELYLQICGDFRYQEHIQSICKKWIDGQTPMEINNKETIGIAEVESLCNKRISYEMNFLIGNICDLIEVDGENEEQVDQRNILTLLQKKVKYGVPNMTAISICESVFNDRLLAIELAQILSDANIGTDKILNMLKAHSEEIFSCLDSYPEYFKDRLSVLMK